jgi:hypothetical protein
MQRLLYPYVHRFCGYCTSMFSYKNNICLTPKIIIWSIFLLEGSRSKGLCSYGETILTFTFSLPSLWHSPQCLCSKKNTTAVFGCLKIFESFTILSNFFWHVGLLRRTLKICNIQVTYFAMLVLIFTANMEMKSWHKYIRVARQCFSTIGSEHLLKYCLQHYGMST